MSYSHYHPAYPYGYPPHGYPAPSHPGYATPPHHPPHHGYYPYAAPPAPAPANGTNDLAAEEAAALAHLQAIQARRRAQEQESAPATRPPVNFGEFIARAIAEERKREREEAAQAKARAEARAAKEHAEREARRAKEHAERKAREAKEEAERIARKARECAARHAEKAREEASRARAVAIAEARQAKWNAMMAARQRYAQQQVEARRQWIQQRAAQAQQVREALAENEYAQRAARYAREAAKPHVEKYANHIGQLNEVLGSLFGINLVQDEQAEEKTQEKQSEKQTEEKHVEFKEPVVEEPAAAPAFEKEANPATETKEASAVTAKEQPNFPDSINDILGSFLGLRVEPTTKDATAPSAPADLSGLNELLGRFGLVFEPDTPSADAPEAGPSTSTTAPASVPVPAEASSSTTKEAPVHEETPLTSFLNGVTDLPPFVRDILGNLEQAWKEEATASQSAEVSGKKDKGKGVAHGEKPNRAPAPETPSPAESDSSTTSLSTLSSIADELALVRDSFTFPARLAFAPSTEGSAPALLFNKTNSTYHAQANKLLQLLLAADGVSSGGDREVRSRRKELVRAVESEIQELEKKRDAVWDEVKARREASGEISEDEDGLSTGSAAPSVIDHEEDRDVVFHYDEPVEHVEHGDAEKVDGFDVPTPAPETATEVTPAPAAEAHVETKEVEVEEEETDNVDRKDTTKPVDKKVLDAEEYELL